MYEKLEKEKLRFRRVDSRVTIDREKYLKELFLESLKENEDIAGLLDKYYNLIQVFLFYDAKDPRAETTIRGFLEVSGIEIGPVLGPMGTFSARNQGCILIFLEKFNEVTAGRKDIKDIRSFHKFGVFEELCHLAINKGDMKLLLGVYPNKMKRYSPKQLAVYAILNRLRQNRNHYEVYNMMIKAYPQEWVERFWGSYKSYDPDVFEKRYKEWTSRESLDIVLAILITEYLQDVSILLNAQKVQESGLSKEYSEKLAHVKSTLSKVVEYKKNLLKQDLDRVSFDIINLMEEKVFETDDSFFSFVLSLWERLKLI